MTSLLLRAVLLTALSVATSHAAPVLDPETFHPLIDGFAQQDTSNLPAFIPNEKAWDWMKENTPFFECPNAQMQEIYYFRWWSYRKHITQTPDGFIITEFLPKVPWAGKDGSISCAAGHHIYEGRWIRDPQYINCYSRFWFSPGATPRLYSFWVADSIWARYLATDDATLVRELLPKLVANYEGWEKDHFDAKQGLFWQKGDRDGMEYSLSGNGFRPTINSYMYGDAVAIANMADLVGDADLKAKFQAKADTLRDKVQADLWDSQDQFFKAMPKEGAKLVQVREEMGFIPWYFNLPKPGSGDEVAWSQLLDKQGFAAPFGPTSSEQRNPYFMQAHSHDCLWNGPSWPYATSQTLVALANLLDNYSQTVVTPSDYVALLDDYTNSNYRDGKPWIAEDLDARTGKWIVDKPRSVYYNHSTYADLIITGLIGLRPRADNKVEIKPLAPSNWDYFCLQDVSYHGHLLTIFFDRTGQRYHRGAGMHLLVDDHEVAQSPQIGPLTAKLP